MLISSMRAIAIILGFCILIPHPALASNHTANPYLVIDVNDGSIISANNEFDRWYPASLTKLMSFYVTAKAISNGEIKIGSPVRISNRASKMPPSRMGYKTGTLLRTDTALKIVIVKSANDVAVALAESVSGTVEKFVERMNQNAKWLGLTATRFANPNGLHSPNQFTSARDLAVLSRRILLDFPQYSHWFAIPAIRSGKKTHYSYNLLLERYEGASGMKTGFICASGYNMVASAKRNGRQLIAIILGAKSQTDRAVLAARLLNGAFENPDRLIGTILTNAAPSLPNPKNMRPVLCTQEAVKNRYEPGAGVAVIKSSFLSERKIVLQPIAISPGEIDGEPSAAYLEQKVTPARSVAVPTKRPKFVPKPVEAPIIARAKNVIELPVSVAIPVPRPQLQSVN